MFICGLNFVDIYALNNSAHLCREKERSIDIQLNRLINGTYCPPYFAVFVL
jgi:hypothetical protein